MQYEKAAPNSRLRLSTRILKIGVLAVVCFAAVSVTAEQERKMELRTAVAGKKFAGAVQVGSNYYLQAPNWLHANRLELGIGAITHADDTRAFVSLGPAWRWQRPASRTYLEFGFSPTVFCGSTFGDRRLGGNFHFTSAISIGRRFHSLDGAALTLRLQHISNGGLNESNPGMDMLGISFMYGFSH